MTVFTTSSPWQISFQIWFPYENPSQATHWLCWLLHEQTYICICVAFVMLRDPPWRHPGDEEREREKGTHYHFCILSPFHSSSGFVSTKSAKAVFFVVRYSTLVNQSGVAHVSSERRKLLKVNVLTPQHVGIVTVFCVLHLSKNRIDHICLVPPPASFSFSVWWKNLLSETPSNTGNNITLSLQLYSSSQCEWSDLIRGGMRMV